MHDKLAGGLCVFVSECLCQCVRAFVYVCVCVCVSSHECLYMSFTRPHAVACSNYMFY